MRAGLVLDSSSLKVVSLALFRNVDGGAGQQRCCALRLLKAKKSYRVAPAVCTREVFREDVCRHALCMAVFQLKDASAERFMEPSDVYSMHPLQVSQFGEFPRPDV